MKTLLLLIFLLIIFSSCHTTKPTSVIKPKYYIYYTLITGDTMVQLEDGSIYLWKDYNKMIVK